MRAVGRFRQILASTYSVENRTRSPGALCQSTSARANWKACDGRPGRIAANAATKSPVTRKHPRKRVTRAEGEELNDDPPHQWSDQDNVATIAGMATKPNDRARNSPITRYPGFVRIRVMSALQKVRWSDLWCSCEITAQFRPTFLPQRLLIRVWQKSDAQGDSFPDFRVADDAKSTRSSPRLFHPLAGPGWQPRVEGRRNFPAARSLCLCSPSSARRSLGWFSSASGREEVRF
jgi:hypothetical protein